MNFCKNSKCRMHRILFAEKRVIAPILWDVVLAFRVDIRFVSGLILFLWGCSGTFSSRYSAPLVECRDFSVCQRACALIVRTIVHLFCAIWTPQGGGKRESCVYSNAKINLLFRIEEVFAKQFSVFLRTVVVIDKNKWTFFRLLSCFVSFLASFGGKRAPFLLAPSAVAPRVCRYA